MTIKPYASSFNLKKESAVEAQDIIDAVVTLKPATKLEVKEGLINARFSA